MPRWKPIVFGSAVLIVLGTSGVAAWLHGLVDPLWRPLQAALAPRPALVPADAALAEQLARLQAENVTLRDRLAEYQQIRGEGNQDPQRVVVARGRIVARSQRAGRRYLELDTGAVDGVAKGQAVCSGWTLVGMVAGIQDGRCLVQLLTDRESRIPAVILNGRAGAAPPERLAEGVCAGLGKRRELALLLVDRSNPIAPAIGMPVVTAGGDDRLPPGMVIGSIQAVEPGADDHWSITVAPLRDPDLLDDLLVIKTLDR
jgi:cell shape-determining protein MreC